MHGIFGLLVSRYGGILIVAGGVAAALVALGPLLQFTIGADSDWLISEQPIGWNIYERVWGKVAAIDRFHRRGQLAAGTRLGVVVGGSSTEAGFQPGILDASAKAAARWLVLAGSGMSFTNIENVSQPIFFCSL